MANEIQKADKPQFSVALTEELHKVNSALPEGFNQQRFVQNAVALLNGNDTLTTFAKEHGTDQIKQEMLQAAYLGLDFMSNEAYLVPYGKKLDFTISYKGKVKLAQKYSVRPVKDMYAKLVREDDEFIESIVNGEPSINFTPKPFNNGKVIGAFAVCLFADGGMTYETMSLEELQKVRKHSKMSNKGAWNDWTDQMYLKSVLHRLCKNIELDLDTNQRIIYDEDMAIETDPHEVARQDIAENANTEDFVIDADATEVPFN